MAGNHVRQIFPGLHWSILVNDSIFSRKVVQEYVTHPEKNLNKRKTKGNFATLSTKEVFMRYPLCYDKHDLDERKSFKKKGLHERIRFLFEQKLCYGCFFSNIYESQDKKL